MYIVLCVLSSYSDTHVRFIHTPHVSNTSCLQVTVELVDITMIGGGGGGGGGGGNEEEGDEEEGDVDLEEVDALRVIVKVVNRNFITGLSHLDLDWCLGPCEHTAVTHHCSGPLELNDNGFYSGNSSGSGNGGGSGGGGYGGGDGGGGGGDGEGVPPQSSVECVVDLPLSSLVDFVDTLLNNNNNNNDNNNNNNSSSSSSGGGSSGGGSGGGSVCNGEIKEIWMNVTAVLSEDTSWAPAGHEIIKVRR